MTFSDYSSTGGGTAMTCLEWSSSGNPEGFQCRVDAEAFQDCKCVHACEQEQKDLTHVRIGVSQAIARSSEIRKFRLACCRR